MKLPTLGQLVKDNQVAEFVAYRDGQLWYGVNWNEVPTGEGKLLNNFHTFEFPVPISDTGTGTFTRNIKAITLMRWIRKHLEYLNDSLKEAGITKEG